MKMQKKLWLVPLMFAGLLAVVGCQEKGPMEKAGEKVDNTAEKMGNAVEDACEDAKQAAGAEDSDC